MPYSTGDGVRVMLIDQSIELGAQNWYGGTGMFIVWGEPGFMDFPTVTLQITPNNGDTWVDVGQDASGAPNTASVVVLPAGPVRAKVDGLFGTSQINAMLVRLP
jgi:hypothetical protein